MRSLPAFGELAQHVAQTALGTAIGRLASAAAPYTVASLAQSRGFGIAFSVAALAFVLAAVIWIWIPETKGRALD